MRRTRGIPLILAGLFLALPALGQSDDDLFPMDSDDADVNDVAPPTAAPLPRVMNGAETYSATAVSNDAVRSATRDPRLLAGVRDYPAGVLRALMDLASDPLVLEQIAQTPTILEKPDSAEPPIPETLRPAILALRSVPEAAAIAAANPSAVIALRRMYREDAENVAHRLAEMRDGYARAEIASAALWQQVIESDPVALGEYRDLVSQFTREILSKAPNFAVTQVLDRRYYAACPPDAQLLSLLSQRAETQALRRALTGWAQRVGPEKRDTVATRGGKLPGANDPLAARPPSARAAMWRAIDSGETPPAGADLIPMMLQPAGDLDDTARLARATVEHARLWSEISGARREPAAPAPQVATPRNAAPDDGMDDLDDGPVVDPSGGYVDTNTHIRYSRDYGDPYDSGTYVYGTGDYGYIWSGYYGFGYPFFAYGRGSRAYYPHALCSTLPGYVPAYDLYHGYRRDYDGYRRDRYSRYRPPAVNAGGYPLPDYPRSARDGRRGYGTPYDGGGKGVRIAPPSRTPVGGTPSGNGPRITPSNRPPRNAAPPSGGNRGGQPQLQPGGGRRTDAGSTPEGAVTRDNRNTRDNGVNADVTKRPRTVGIPGFNTRREPRSNTGAAAPTPRSVARPSTPAPRGNSNPGAVAPRPAKVQRSILPPSAQQPQQGRGGR